MTQPHPTADATLDAGALGRRRFLGCALAFGVTGPLLVACSSGSDDAGSGGTGGTGSGGQSLSPSSGSSLVAVTDVPVGGGVALTDVQIVVTQPTKGTFKAFSAICTHQGCPVTRVSGGTIDCPCHGSQFSIEDGSVEGGPAPRGLPEKKVTVTGSTLTVA